MEFNRVTVRWNRQTVASLIHGGGGIAGENGASIDIRESVLTSNHMLQQTETKFTYLQAHNKERR